MAAMADGVGPFSECYRSESQAQISEFIRRWDEYVVLDAALCVNKLLPEVMAQCESKYGVVPVLVVREPEIVSRVLNLYIAQVQRNWTSDLEMYKCEDAPAAKEDARAALYARNERRIARLLESSLRTHGDLRGSIKLLPRDPRDHEGLYDFERTLATAAESTLDEKIYDEVWNASLPGELRNPYLAEVAPERTVEEICSASLGFMLGEQRHAEDRFFREGDGGGIGMTSAFEVLAMLCKRHPGVASKYSNELRSFVRAHSLHFGKSNGTKYRETLDYLVRVHALDILHAVAIPEDRALVESLLLDPPRRAPARSKYEPPLGEDIQVRGAKVLDAIHAKAEGREPSSDHAEK
jgi:hypothetical protein